MLNLRKVFFLRLGENAQHIYTQSHLISLEIIDSKMTKALLPIKNKNF